jgi:hypothetical protein
MIGSSLLHVGFWFPTFGSWFTESLQSYAPQNVWTDISLSCHGIACCCLSLEPTETVCQSNAAVYARDTTTRSTPQFVGALPAAWPAMLRSGRWDRSSGGSALSRSAPSSWVGQSAGFNPAHHRPHPLTSNQLASANASTSHTTCHAQDASASKEVTSNFHLGSHAINEGPPLHGNKHNKCAPAASHPGRRAVPWRWSGPPPAAGCPPAAAPPAGSPAPPARSACAPAARRGPCTHQQAQPAESEGQCLQRRLQLAHESHTHHALAGQVASGPQSARNMPCSEMHLWSRSACAMMKPSWERSMMARRSNAPRSPVTR